MHFPDIALLSKKLHLCFGDTTKPKIRRRKDLLLATGKKNPRDIFQISVFPNSKIREVLS